MIQRSKALIETIINLPTSEIEQLTINTSARICAAVGYIPTAGLSILNFITSSSDSDTEAQVQAVIDLADYPDLVTHLCNALETKFPGMCAADKETDVVGSLCSKLRLLARCYPHQVREIVGNAPSQDTMQTTSTMAIDTNEVAMTPQAWPSIYGDMDSIFPGDDMQWDNILSNFTGLSWNGS